MMDEKIKKFIEENIELIELNKWEQIYQKQFPFGFTETLLDCGINPLYQGLNYIPKHFLYNSKIEEFIIPNNITSIGYWAFKGCSSLTSITIGNSVTSIGNSMFHSCINLTSVTIPNSVTSIGDFAFKNCTNLTSVTIPTSVTNIGESAFYKCSNLESVTIGNSVIHIGDEAFRHCTNLTSVTIPANVPNIGDYAFSDCKSLAELKYLGTKKEAIKCGIGNRSRKKWREKSDIEKIICTDGVIEL